MHLCEWLIPCVWDTTSLNVHPSQVAKERKNVGFIDEGEKREMLREMFDVKLWDKVESTPHGHYSKMFDAESKAGHRVPLPDASRKPDAQKCSIVLDHYNYDRSYKSTAAELPKGKRVGTSLLCWWSLERGGVLTLPQCPSLAQ